MRWSRHVTLCVLIATCVAFATAPSALASGTWQITTFGVKGPVSESIRLVTASGPKNAWALAYVAPTTKPDYIRVLRSRGGSWQAVSLPTKISHSQGLGYSWIGSSRPSNVWMLGAGLSGFAAHWNGRRWSTTGLPGCCDLLVYSGAVLSATSAWAFGGIVPRGRHAQHPYVSRLVGRSWTRVRLPRAIADIPLAIVDASAVSSTDIWALLGQSFAPAAQTQLIHWNGHAWSRLRFPSALAGNFPATILASGPSSVWVGAWTPNGTVGHVETLWHWTSSGWTQYQIPAAVAATTQGAWITTGLADDGHGGLWVEGFSSNGGLYRLWDFDNGVWTGPQTVGGSEITIDGLTSVPNSATVFAYGFQAGQPAQDTRGVIAKYLP